MSHSSVLGVNPMANSSALSSESVPLGNHETAATEKNMLPASAIQSTTPNANSTVPYNVSGVNIPQSSVLGVNVNPMANSSALPSESVPLGNYETAATEKNAPMPGAAKKSSKMRPGTTNTARCDCG